MKTHSLRHELDLLHMPYNFLLDATKCFKNKDLKLSSFQAALVNTFALRNVIFLTIAFSDGKVQSYSTTLPLFRYPTTAYKEQNIFILYLTP